jgi:hypothetical protein
MAHVIRSRIRMHFAALAVSNPLHLRQVLLRGAAALLLAVVLASLPAAQARAQCLGDCNGDGSVGAGELTNIIALINCCPCSGALVGGAPAGCAATGGCTAFFPGGTVGQCTAADRNVNQCVTAGELTGVIADILNYQNGCPPVAATNTPVTPATATNTPVTPATATNTPVTPATATNTPVTPATATNTPVTPATATNTPVTPATATNTPVTPATATNTPVTPATATNTPVTPATATNTPTAPPTNTPTRTNTPVTPSPTPTTPAPLAACGNGVIESGEDCDPGGTCIGGNNAGTHCTSESGCVGQGVCDAGPNALQACDNVIDCPGSRCIHCKTFGGIAVAGGHTCAANCTYETSVPVNLIKGIIIPGKNVPQDGTSSSVVKSSGAIPIPPLALAGSHLYRIGREVNGKIPVREAAADAHVTGPTPGVDGIQVSSLACACVRALIAETCGGVLNNKDGTTATDCTPEFQPGACATPVACATPNSCGQGEICSNGKCTCHTRDQATECTGTGNSCVVPDPCVVGGDKPCTFVHGPGNSASGVIGCDGLDNINLNASQDGGNSIPPLPPTPPPGSGLAVLELRNACECAGDTDCGSGQTCDANGRCTCTTGTDCPSSASTSAYCLCPALANTPCPTPGTGVCLNHGCVDTADCPGTLTCQGGPPGSAVIVNSSAIGQSPTGQLCVIPTRSPGAGYGGDHKWCTNDDPETSRGVPQTLPSVTGFAVGIITNEYNGGGTPKVQGPYGVLGKPLDCSLLLAPTPSMSGSGLGGVFTAINQPSLANIVTTNVQYSQ